MQRYLLLRKDPKDAETVAPETTSRVLDVTGQACQFVDGILGPLGIIVPDNRRGLAFSIQGGHQPGDYLLVREDVDQTELEQAQVQVKQAGDRVRCLMEALDKAQMERDQAQREAELVGRSLSRQNKRAAKKRAAALGDPHE